MIGSLLGQVFAALTAATASTLLGFHAENVNATPPDPQLEMRVQKAVLSILELADTRVVPQASAAEPCRGALRGKILFNYQLYIWMPEKAHFRRDAIATIEVSGCHGGFADVHSVFGSGEASETAKTPSATPAQNAMLLQRAVDSALSAFSSSHAANSTFVSNLLRCGLPLGANDKTAFWGVRWQAGGAIVTNLEPNGTAARAGVRENDRITSINGIAVSESNLSSLLLQAERAERWTVEGTLCLVPRPGCKVVRE